MLKFININDYNNIFFTSDTHYGHENIVKGVSKWPENSGQRNFNTVEEMNDVIVDNINKFVTENDLLIHCGDWSFDNKHHDFIERINTKNIAVVQGNHDHKLDKSMFTKYEQLLYLQYNNQIFFCSHYPNVVWHQSHKGCINVYGHVHGSYTHPGKAIDVGIDNAYKMFGEYRPFTFDEVINYCNDRKILFESHHDANTN